MKKISLFLGLFLVITVTGCNKMKKGVLEMRLYLAYPYSSTYGAREVFKCVNVDGDLIDFNEGEIKKFNVINHNNIVGYSHVEYIYHANKSAKDLGYTRKVDAYKTATHYGTFDWCYYTDVSGKYGVPAVNSGFGQIAGAWKHPATGEVVWIDSDRSGKGILIDGGSKFPNDAKGGVCLTDVRKTGQYSYTAQNHTYYPSGWVPGAYLDFEMNEDGNSFKLGYATWIRVY